VLLLHITLIVASITAKRKQKRKFSLDNIYTALTRPIGTGMAEADVNQRKILRTTASIGIKLILPESIVIALHSRR